MRKMRLIAQSQTETVPFPAQAEARAQKKICVAYPLLIVAQDVVIVAASRTEPELKDVLPGRGVGVAQPAFSASSYAGAACALPAYAGGADVLAVGGILDSEVAKTCPETPPGPLPRGSIRQVSAQGCQAWISDNELECANRVRSGVTPPWSVPIRIWSTRASSRVIRRMAIWVLIPGLRQI